MFWEFYYYYSVTILFIVEFLFFIILLDDHFNLSISSLNYFLIRVDEVKPSVVFSLIFIAIGGVLLFWNTGWVTISLLVVLGVIILILLFCFFDDIKKLIAEKIYNHNLFFVPFITFIGIVGLLFLGNLEQALIILFLTLGTINFVALAFFYSIYKERTLVQSTNHFHADYKDSEDKLRKNVNFHIINTSPSNLNWSQFSSKVQSYIIKSYIQRFYSSTCDLLDFNFILNYNDKYRDKAADFYKDEINNAYKYDDLTILMFSILEQLENHFNEIRIVNRGINSLYYEIKNEQKTLRNVPNPSQRTTLSFLKRLEWLKKQKQVLEKQNLFIQSLCPFYEDQLKKIGNHRRERTIAINRKSFDFELSNTLGGMSSLDSIEYLKVKNEYFTAELGQELEEKIEVEKIYFNLKKELNSSQSIEDLNLIEQELNGLLCSE